MAIVPSTQNFFASQQELTFSELQSTFGGHDGNRNVKFSTYKRDPISENPVVPDSTENRQAGISSDTNLSIDTFRGSNKSYDVTVNSGTYENVQFQNYFNHNLKYNIPKTIQVNGTVVSENHQQFAAEIDMPNDANGNPESIQNLDMEVTNTGAIYGAAPPKAAKGGGALYIESGANNRRVNIKTSGDGKIWAAGGGGVDGQDGDGASGNCEWDEQNNYRRNAATPCTRWYREARSYRYNVNFGNGRGCAGKGGAGCRRCGNCVKRATGTNPATSGCNPNPNRATRHWNRDVRRVAISAGGGPKGTGGQAQGWKNGAIQNAASGNPGRSGGSASCNSPYSGTSIRGGSGNPGNPGGAWGVSPQGSAAAGEAIKHKGVVNIEKNEDQIKGTILKVD
jgi:hypothetical protein